MAYSSPSKPYINVVNPTYCQTASPLNSASYQRTTITPKPWSSKINYESSKVLTGKEIFASIVKNKNNIKREILESKGEKVERKTELKQFDSNQVSI